MRYFALLVLASVLAIGCNKEGPTPAQPVPPAKNETIIVPPAPPRDPAGGVHVNDPAGRTKVDVDPSGVHVNTPGTKVEVK